MRDSHRSMTGTVFASAVAIAGVAFLALGSVRAAEDCAACHEDIARAFSGTGHGRAFAFGDGYSGRGCESCHGDGAMHAEAGGDATKIVNPRSAEAGKANATCLECHATAKHAALWQGSAHEAADVKCVDCHAVHGAHAMGRGGKMVRNETELCLSCHSGQKASVTKRSRHPLAEGKMACTSCHNPHGTTTEHLVKADSVNDLCWSCHQDKRGPYLWEHSPVREDCLNCHNAHGSNHDKMLVARPTQLCQSCHMQGRHQTLAGTPTTVWNLNRECQNCHSQIHGSNHPSGPLFQR